MRAFVPKLRVCLTGGRHTPGSAWERECPLRPGGAMDQRRSAARASADARRQRKRGQDHGIQGSPGT
jgi:hypothetical protein